MRSGFRERTVHLYDAVYRGIRDEALAYRLTERGVKVSREGPDRPVARPMERYVPDLVRAVRNSAHGFLDLLSGPDRFLIATHSGRLPPEFPELAFLIGLGLVADAEATCAGNWWASPNR